MTEDHFLDEFPAEESLYFPDRNQPINSAPTPNESARKSQLMGLWDGISRAGLADMTLRLGTHALLVALILLVAWGMREFYSRANLPNIRRGAVFAASLPTATPTEAAPGLPPFVSHTTDIQGISRQVSLHTDVPSRPRMEVTQYTVKKGDTLFGIAEKFGLEPETILWANQYVLGDNPHNLRPDQKLNILPVNGAYHKWSAGDGLNGVSRFFGVTPEDIVNFPGNHLNPDTIGDYAHPNIEAGTWLVIPGGRREFISWSAPSIPRENPGVASVLGPGACSAVSGGANGVGVFVWPADHHFLSGFDYSPNMNHSGIDIDGNTGDAVYAVDNGVVVYAGWNNWGYGNVVVINHGNGWQTLYAHLSAINVTCGQSVYQTNVIGLVGDTGNSAGSHLHFEMMYNGTKVNPHDYLP